MVEDVMKEMKRILETHLETELSKQDGKYGDGINLAMPTQILQGDETIKESGLPLIILKPTEAETALWATNKKDVTYTFDICVAVTDTDEDVSQRRLWRTMRAVESCLEIHAPGSSPIINFQTVGMNFKTSLFTFSEDASTEKGGIINASVMERLDAYTESQL